MCDLMTLDESCKNNPKFIIFYFLRIMIIMMITIITKEIKALKRYMKILFSWLKKRRNWTTEKNTQNARRSRIEKILMNLGMYSASKVKMKLKTINPKAENIVYQRKYLGP